MMSKILTSRFWGKLIRIKAETIHCLVMHGSEKVEQYVQVEELIADL